MLVRPADAMMIEPQWIGDADIKARFLVDDENPDKAALYIRLSEGWHTYWIVPGDAGLPPRFTWTNQENIKDIQISYPVPKRFDEMGLTTFGYSGGVILPIKLMREDNGKSARADLALNIMICSDICIPKILNLELDTTQFLSVAHGDKGVLNKAYAYKPRAKFSDGVVLQNARLGKDKIITEVTLPDSARNHDIENMDAFALIYDSVEAFNKSPETGLPLMGEVIKHVDDDTKKVRFEIPSNHDISDLNMFARGKLVYVLVRYQDIGVFADVRVPVLKTRKSVRDGREDE